KLIGICGGYQMLGQTVADPHCVEGAPGVTTALGLLEIDTTLTQDKRLAQVTGHCAFADTTAAAAVSGYEIDMGTSHGVALTRLDRSTVLFGNGNPVALSWNARPPLLSASRALASLAHTPRTLNRRRPPSAERRLHTHVALHPHPPSSPPPCTL